MGVIVSPYFIRICAGQNDAPCPKGVHILIPQNVRLLLLTAKGTLQM